MEWIVLCDMVYTARIMASSHLWCNST